MGLRNRAKRVAVAGVSMAMMMTVGLTACGSNSGPSGGGVTINVAGQADNLTQVFNPYLPVGSYDVMSGDKTWVYEPLVQTNPVDIGNDHPWLAEKWEWSDQNKKVTFHLRTNVKWTDGEKFTSKDVVFTYNLLTKYPALNTTGVVFKTVEAPDENTVVFTFDASYEPYFFLLSNVPIVPEHTWSKVDDPTTYADENPVGTGPFMLDQFSPQAITMKKNPNYWQEGKPKIDGLRFIAYKDNQAQTNALVQGDVDWGSTFIANAEQTYLGKSDKNHYWHPTVGLDGLIPNLEKWPLSELSVRKAISLAVDREQVAQSTNDVTATSQIGLPMPAFESVIDPQFKGLNYVKDLTKAKQTLEADGWTMGPDGVYVKDGKPCSFTITFPSAYTDITARAQVIIDNLKQVGIKAEINGVAVSDINNLTSMGDFESTIGYPVAAPPNAYLYYDFTMNPSHYVPTGQADPSYMNIERFQNAAAEKAFADYLVAGSDEERAKNLGILEKAWVEELPMITIFYWGYYGDWSTEKVTGFPDDSNPYFRPNANPVTAINLVPVTK
ncbi:MAG: ABC transporter substrate-binding protein [Propionibacteriaceae bacterium]|jgi:peptide/nickel transport system substrate-binding protein|nr:ABC transporter substrate-binding protein [Propionibacteriaceae bacterium]